jgi:hypothetical protein
MIIVHEWRLVYGAEIWGIACWRFVRTF